MPDENSLQRLHSTAATESSVSRQFDARVASAFCERSVSEETRRAYRRVVREFFRFTGPCHPEEITPQEVQRWRDGLIAQKKSSSTVAFKLSIVRSLFDYLQVGGYVTRNPALSKLVPPPAVPEDLSGRALTAKEVRYVLSGPNREKPGSFSKSSGSGSHQGDMVKCNNGHYYSSLLALPKGATGT
ncbi:MAG: site-specific integrase [Acidobacteriota bacterium]|nr:site-specific integrase [Acidobacteriota bacterium]